MSHNTGIQPMVITNHRKTGKLYKCSSQPRTGSEQKHHSITLSPVPDFYNVFNL